MTPPIKTCFKCGKSLPLDEFYRHPQMKDGHLNKCKACTRKDTKENRLVHREYYLDYDHKRQATASRKEWLTKYQRIRRAKEPQKNLSRAVVSRALRSGKLIRQPCAICGAIQNIQAHHEDYSKPLDVIWLCFKHHRWIHS